MPEIAGRDPRSDPKPGDVLRLVEGLTVEVGLQTSLHIFFAISEEIAGLTRSIARREWRKWAKDAEVLTIAE